MRDSLALLRNHMNYLQTLWAKIPATWQEHITSAWHTFITAAILELGYEFSVNQQAFSTGTVTRNLLLAIGASAVRAGVKAVFGVIYASAKSNSTPPQG